MKNTYRPYRKILGILFMSLAVAFISSCGNDQNRGSINAVINNVQVEMDVLNVNCFAGIDPREITCNNSIRTPGFFADYIRFDVYDVITIFNQSMGEWIPVNSNLIGAEMSFNATNVSILDGAVRFTRLTNNLGGEVCAQYQLNIGFGNGYVDGQFCGTLANGF